MKVSSEHKVEMSFRIPDEIHVETGHALGPNDVGPAYKVLRIWSRSEESVADAVTKIIQMSDSLVAALKETK